MCYNGLYCVLLVTSCGCCVYGTPLLCTIDALVTPRGPCVYYTSGFCPFSGRWGYLWVHVFLGGIPLALSVPETSLPPPKLRMRENKQTKQNPLFVLVARFHLIVIFPSHFFYLFPLPPCTL